MHPVDRLLQSFRAVARTEREKGTSFENFCAVFLRNDPVQAQQFDDVWSYADWAKEQGASGKDIGIDLVAKLRDDEGYAAIQCKFHKPDDDIKKEHIDSFLAVSSKRPFKRRIIIDTTESEWSNEAEDTIKDQTVPVNRIGLQDLRSSNIDWTLYEQRQDIKLAEKKKLLKHQTEAIKAVCSGFQKHDRGKLIMACGTGKTFTSLRVAEHIAGKGGGGKYVLFLVPSLALIAQTIREWTNDAELELRSFAVCSDSQVGKRHGRKNDTIDVEAHDLAFPANTKPEKLAQKASVKDSSRMTVVFATYQSLPVITAAQQQGLPEFDLIVCDEAHRTTGAKFAGVKESNFIKVHDNKQVAGKKRLYMTATPRIFGEAARAKAADAAVELCDMNDETIYGPTFYALGFGKAVENDLLTDYKVVVLAVDEGMVSRTVQKRLSVANELLLDDATKIVGCYKALLKQGNKGEFKNDTNPVRRAIAFCKDIRTSKLVSDEFQNVVSEFNEATMNLDIGGGQNQTLECEVEHVDGTFKAKSRGRLLNWLNDDVGSSTCRVLSNARCLSEGVDVPALDAILFMHPRKSQIDVVQSVGRVMRRDKDKNLGYVVLPVIIPAGIPPEEALNDNERYRVVWQVLNALRSHDDRFDATINKLELNNNTEGQIEVIAVTEKLPQKTQFGNESSDVGSVETTIVDPLPPDQIEFIFDEFPAAIRAKIVQKCGRRNYWQDWAKDVGEIARKQITRITTVISQDSVKRGEFELFMSEIRDDLNSEVSESEAIEMLAQHMITRPVFGALFEKHEFTANNPVSVAMEKIVALLEKDNLDKEVRSLEGFYESVRFRAKGIDNAEGRQKIMVELYDKFFRTAFPTLTQKLGIVYTPVEIVDFINNSVNDILQRDFGQSLGRKGVHILDPFTGTGTFIARLLQSGLIKSEELEQKFKYEIHANEIVLLAYYIAAINIESVYLTLSGKKFGYEPFNGICLADTFAMYEKEDIIADLMEDNSKRRVRQKSLDIRIIIGNPPYSSGQKSQNDNAKNVVYPALDEAIRSTYTTHSHATNRRNLYDNYVRAIRWASDRLGKDGGIVGFITGNGWLDKKFANGMRKSLAEEFTNIYVVNLRGDVRKGMLNKIDAKQEGENVFGQGTMTGVAIVFLVKRTNCSQKGKIYCFDGFKNLDRNKKLKLLQYNRSIVTMLDNDTKVKASKIQPDEYYDWINQRNKNLEKHIIVGNKTKKSTKCMFNCFSLGVATNRDAWCINFSKSKLKNNIQRHIEEYNRQLNLWNKSGGGINVDDFVEADSTKIAWTRALKNDLKKGKKLSYSTGHIQLSHYRPFQKQWLYYSRRLNESVNQIHRIYPVSSTKNRTIGISGVGAGSFSALMCDSIPNLHTIDSAQHFPQYAYESVDNNQDIFSSNNESVQFHMSDNITDVGLKYFQEYYGNSDITKNDIFYYTYGLLHNEDYREQFAINLVRELARIPLVKQQEDLWSFVESGRKLAELHIDYENVEPYPVMYENGELTMTIINDPIKFYRVEKMKFGKDGKVKNKTVVRYNNDITITGIPLEAYDYIVNGHSALESVMRRWCIRKDNASGIINDPNDYANETMNDPAYPLKLFQRIITVSLETMDIVRNLPKLDID